MNKKYVWMGAVIGVAVLLWLGQWLYGMYQDNADRTAAIAIEKQYASRNNANAGQSGGAVPGGPNGQRRWGSGQGGGGGQWAQRGARRMEELTKEVGLNQAQVKQVQAAQASSRSLMGDIFRNPNLTREQKMAQMQQLRAAQQAQISKILTPDQQTKYTTFQEKMRSQWQARRQANGGGGGYGGGWGGGTGEMSAPQRVN